MTGRRLALNFGICIAASEASMFGAPYLRDHYGVNLAYPYQWSWHRWHEASILIWLLGLLAFVSLVVWLSERRSEASL